MLEEKSSSRCKALDDVIVFGRHDGTPVSSLRPCGCNDPSDTVKIFRGQGSW